MLLVLKFFAQEGHGPVEMMQAKVLGLGQGVIAAPPVAESIRAACKQAMKDGQEKRPFHIEGEEPALEKFLKHPGDAKGLPQALEDQSRGNPAGEGRDLASLGEHEQVFFRKPGQGADQRFHLFLGAHLVQTAQRGDDPLVHLGAVPTAFNNLEVLVLPGLFHTSIHAAVSRFDTATLRE